MEGVLDVACIRFSTVNGAGMCMVWTFAQASACGNIMRALSCLHCAWEDKEGLDGRV